MCVTHTCDDLLNRLRQILAHEQLLVVSNRQPCVHRRSKGGLVVEKPAGGLVTARESCEAGGLRHWIAWGDGDADFEIADARNCAAVMFG